MSLFDADRPVSRRRALALGGGVAAGAVLAGEFPGTADAAVKTAGGAVQEQHGALPAEQMQAILHAQGTVSEGVLSIDIDRDDIGEVHGPLNVMLTPAFELNGTLTFQPLGQRAFFNGDLALKPAECNTFIDAIIADGLVLQAFHQHYIETIPAVWFIHWRGQGAPLQLARAVKNVLDVTSTPFPQQPPTQPKTPLDPDRLASILHGSAEVGAEGVVTVTIDRTDRIVIDGVHVSPQANIFTEVQFKPLSSGSHAAVGPDFSMTSAEVMPVITVMRRQGWFQGCLYNQETDEHPQLYFDHMLKTGDAYTLAREIRRGLNHTASA